MHVINEALPKRSASEKRPHHHPRGRNHRWHTTALHAASPGTVNQHALISLSLHSPRLTHPGQGPLLRGRGSRLPAASDAAAPATTQAPPPVVQAVLFDMDGVLVDSRDLSRRWVPGYGLRQEDAHAVVESPRLRPCAAGTELASTQPIVRVRHVFAGTDLWP